MTVIQSTSRKAVLAALPAGLERRFDAAAAGELEGTFEMRITGDGETPLAIRVAGGRCRVERRAAPEAGATVTISAGDIVRLITGTVEWPALLGPGRLALGGDPFLALRFPGLFGFSTR